MKLVFATNNKNKLAEVKKKLPNSIQLLSLQYINCINEIEEIAKTLQKNTLIKANYIIKNFDCNYFADYTNLEAESLNGVLVYSANYADKADKPASSENNRFKQN